MSSCLNLVFPIKEEESSHITYNNLIPKLTMVNLHTSYLEVQRTRSILNLHVICINSLEPKGAHDEATEEKKKKSRRERDRRQKKRKGRRKYIETTSISCNPLFRISLDRQWRGG